MNTEQEFKRRVINKDAEYGGYSLGDFGRKSDLNKRNREGKSIIGEEKK